MKAKQTFAPLPVGLRVTIKHRAHTDEMPVVSKGGTHYLVTLVDDHSSFAAVRSVRTKDQVQEAVQEIVVLMETLTDTRVQWLQSDRGREYCNERLRKFYWKKGIMHDTSVPYTPEQNGRAAWVNCTLLEKVRALLQDANLGQDQYDL